MVKERVIPGVSVESITEIVPQQLYPSGIVGLIGTALRGENGRAKAVTSYKELKEVFGDEDGGTLVKEGKLAFMNGVYQVFAIRVEAAAGSNAVAFLKGSEGKNVVQLSAQLPGEQGNFLRAVVKKAKAENHFDIQIFDERNPDRHETWSNVVLERNAENHIERVSEKSSRRLASVRSVTAKKDDVLVEQEVAFSQGTPARPDYKAVEEALMQLEKEPQIDIVYACDQGDPTIHKLVKAHCDNLSTGGEGGFLGPRIGVGSVRQGESAEQSAGSNQEHSDRFVLVSPYGYAGAVAGLLSKLNYYESPTYKKINLDKNFPESDRFAPSELMRLLSAGILPLDLHRERGVIVIKGINTDNQQPQISVRRVADRAIRGVNNICENFIGTLNNARQRMALRERLREFFQQMERDGAIVPSVDETSPAFLVDVYSSQDDFAKGIVRVDIGVRPVRAIDYIYATINVKAY